MFLIRARIPGLPGPSENGTRSTNERSPNEKRNDRIEINERCEDRANEQRRNGIQFDPSQRRAHLPLYRETFRHAPAFSPASCWTSARKSSDRCAPSRRAILSRAPNQKLFGS